MHLDMESLEPEKAGEVLDAQTELEALVDRAGLGNVVECLAIICEAKAEHIRENWQDARSASVWERCARAIDRCAARVRFLGL